MIGRFGVKLSYFVLVQMMLISYLKSIGLIVSLSFITVTAQAEIYQWVDKNGETHFSEQKPDNVDAHVVDAPEPPAMSATDDVQITEENRSHVETTCQHLRTTLEQYRKHPEQRLMDEDGRTLELKAVDRRQNIHDLQQQISHYCQ